MWNDVPAYPTPLILVLSAFGVLLCLLGLALFVDLVRGWGRAARHWGASRAARRGAVPPRVGGDFQRTVVPPGAPWCPRDGTPSPRRRSAPTARAPGRFSGARRSMHGGSTSSRAGVPWPTTRASGPPVSDQRGP
jgi:hypothetical protein